MRLTLFLCAFWAFACAVAAQSNVLMTDTEIGPVRAGMPISELRALGHPYTTRTVSLEGDEYTEYSVAVEGGGAIELLDIDGRADDVSTRSTVFRTARGAHVGATLEELQGLYPEGRLNVGIEEGHGSRFFSFVTRDHEASGVFYFDPDRLPENCFVLDSDCPALMSQRAVSYRAIYQDPMRSLRARAIGPVFLGMTEAEVEALGLPIRSAPEGAVLSVAEGREVTVTFRAGRVWQLATSSRAFVAYRGGQVGATLDQLRGYYPEGRIAGGDGPYLLFVIAPGHAFKFDTGERSDSCTRWDGQPCPAFGLTRAIEYSVTDEP